MRSITERLTLLSAEQRDTFEDRLRKAADTVMAEPIAVVGAGCRLPGGVTGPESYWKLLMDGRDAVAEIPPDRWDADAYYSPDPHTPGRMNSRWGGFLDDVAGFDAEFFGISPREAAAMDPQQRLLLEVAWEALENAGLAPGELRGTRTGLFSGVYYNEYQRAGSGDIAALDAYTSTGNAHSVTVGRVSYLLDLRGPSVAVDSACSSSLVALHLASQSLRLRESDLALAGGVNLILNPETQVALSRWGMLSPEGRCKSFDADADGFVRGEGCGVVVLKRLSDALRDGDGVLAVVRGSAVNQDGRSQGLTAPSGIAQRAVLSEAVARAGVPPASVGLIETHGTGTALGDPIEFEALAEVYGRGRDGCALGAVKTNLGHLEAAAGMAGFIKVVLSLRNATIPPNLHFKAWNPALDPADTRFFVPTAPSPWPVTDSPRRAAVSSFGFGGTNAHVVVEQAGVVPSQPDAPVGRYVLSASSLERIADAASTLADWLEADGATVPLADVAHTLARRSGTGPERAAIVARGRAELVEGLRALAAGTPAPGVLTASGPPTVREVVWVFPEQDSQWADMGRQLLDEEPAFAAAIDDLDSLFQTEAGFSLRELPAKETGQVQPALFGVQLALAALWRSYGIEPAAVIGHSTGEISAAVVSGELSPEDGLRVVTRSPLPSELKETPRVDAAEDGHTAFVEISLRAFHTDLAALLLQGSWPQRSKGQLADLPTTPWRHSRHWMDGGGVQVPAGAHPLLGLHVELPDKGTHVWQSDLGILAQPWLADHRVQGVPVLPGAAYAELMLAAAAEALGKSVHDIALAGLALEEVLPLADHTAVTTVLVPTGADSARVRVHSRTATGGWTTHATAEAAYDPSASAPVHVQETPVHVQEQGEVSAFAPADLYARLRAAGQWHGPAFAGITEVHEASDGSALTTVALAHPDTRFHVHPALLDSCLQTLAAAAPRGPDDDSGTVTYLPMEFGRVRVYGDPAPGGRCHARLTPVDAGLRGEVRLVDPDGTVLLEVTGIYVRRVERRNVPVPLSDKLFETVWERLDPPEGSSKGSWHVVSDPDSGGELIAHLESAGHQVRTGALKLDDPLDGVVVLPSGDPERQVMTVSGIAGDLVANSAGPPPRLWLVTGSAALRGLTRVLALEHPELRTTLLEADTDSAISAELQAGGAETEIAWRSGDRYVARLARAALPEATGTPVVRTGAAYVISGGLGGLGLVVARRLAEHGAGRLVLNGRSAPSADGAEAIAALRAGGTEVVIATGDIAEPGVAERLVADAGPELRGVVHAAAVLDDRVVAGLDAESLHKVWVPKVEGARRLHEATAGADLDWWVAFSSAASLLGSPGQGAYASANAWLDEFVEWRQAQGLPAASINWGAWAEAGLAREGQGVLDLMTPAEGLEALEAVLGSGRAVTGVLRLNVPQVLAAFPQIRTLPYFAHLTEAEGTQSDDDWAGPATLREADPGSARELVIGRVRAQVAAVLGFKADRLAPDVPLTQIGLDSLMAVRIRNAVQHDLDVALSLPALLTGATLTDVEAAVLDALGFAAERTAAATVGPRDAAERLVANVWETVLGSGPVGVTDDFHAIGGTPRLAARIADSLSERTGEVLEAEHLFVRPTVEEMARLVRVKETPGAPVRVLRKEGSRVPVFFFHPAGGDTAVYRRLAGLLGGDQPSSGLERVEDIDGIESKAAYYAELIRDRRPEGPYRLAGWSFGGFLAYETARLLAEDGAEVDLVALIDSVRPLPLPGVSAEDLMIDRFRGFADYLEATYGIAVPLRYDELARLDERGQIDHVMEAVSATGLISQRVAPDILRHQRASFEDLRAIERFDPPRPYDGRVVLYRATDPPVNGLTDPRYERTDATLGWDEVCGPRFEVVPVPGHHLSVLDPPNVEVIARHLGAVLGR